MSSAAHPAPTAGSGPSSSRTTQYRPATIAELANQAQEYDFDESLGLKHWLRSAEKARRSAERLVHEQQYEAAFIEYAKAATIVLERLPKHREYGQLLSADQRQNLGMNGQDILDSLSQLKPILVDRYEKWQASERSSPPSSTPPSRDPNLSRAEERARDAREAARMEEAWKQEDLSRRQAEDRERLAREEAAWRQSQEARRREEPDRAGQTEKQWREEENRRYAAEEAKREERARQKGAEDKRRHEQEGILRRQQEADSAARSARRDYMRTTPSPVGPPSGSAAPPMRMPEPDSAMRSAGRGAYGPQPSQPSAPYESSSKHPDDSFADWSRLRISDQPTKKQVSAAAHPPPLTTTSPPPPDLGPIKYPTLMSQHQLKQGYVPSLQSMFSPTTPSHAPDSSLLFDPKPSGSSNGLYGNILPTPSAPPAPVIPPYPTHMPVPESHRPLSMPQPTSSQHSNTFSQSSHRGPSPGGARPATYNPSRPSGSYTPSSAPPPPPSSSALPHHAPRIVAGSSKDAAVQELRTVRLPRECLDKFLSIARVNTLQNRETCGLLLGKDKGSKYVVTTLLIPKQHSTSDTCMMDEEELVLQFTEDRHLITLGWIHTHPTQSCFMSSVDLHTHSGFQRMLPESFAVVCAPSSTPRFGIFRLTDPAGLQTILGCHAKEAFHPHPDVPIYTDCDDSHVQMKDMPLEIVDLR
ncbi:uncharacterized protein BXZ73DRAFT_78251 [Epithele typhae]|uniref:uncharacterized protein n=1 Tax=Epithele typhae TaxID=378194 RepID=UPI002008AD46|nr:uncharacterized protein BXZ73DRAFT_78251 [Epithele typhae]KAH9929115.1 hypothetical protein BXZ73DRAFT_78251 [Epithele typhae]